MDNAAEFFIEWAGLFIAFVGICIDFFGKGIFGDSHRRKPEHLKTDCIISIILAMGSIMLFIVGLVSFPPGSYVQNAWLFSSFLLTAALTVMLNAVVAEFLALRRIGNPDFLKCLRGTFKDTLNGKEIETRVSLITKGTALYGILYEGLLKTQHNHWGWKTNLGILFAVIIITFISIKFIIWRAKRRNGAVTQTTVG